MPNKILIAEDDTDTAKIIAVRFSRLGNEVLLAPDGQQAVDMARQHVPDLILMDYEMPHLDGLQACDAIKSDAALTHIPVIFMSIRDVDSAAILAARGNGYIAKPFTFEQLLSKIQVHLK